MFTTVAGIPCQIQVDHIEPYVPAYRCGHPDNWAPEEGGEVEFTVLDRRGREAPWLAAKLTLQESSRIKQEIIKESKQ